MCIKLYWSKDTPQLLRLFGTKNMTNFCLVNIFGEPLTNEFEDLQDDIVPFTIENYVERSGSTRPHIILRTKRRSLFELPALIVIVMTVVFVNLKRNQNLHLGRLY